MTPEVNRFGLERDRHPAVHALLIDAGGSMFSLAELSVERKVDGLVLESLEVAPVSPKTESRTASRVIGPRADSGD